MSGENTDFYTENVNPETGEVFLPIANLLDAEKVAYKAKAYREYEASLKKVREKGTEMEIRNQEITNGLLNKYPDGLREVSLEDGSNVAVFDPTLLIGRGNFVHEGLMKDIPGYEDENVTTWLNTYKHNTFVFSKDGLTIIEQTARSCKLLTDNEVRAIIKAFNEQAQATPHEEATGRKYRKINIWDDRPLSVTTFVNGLGSPQFPEHSIKELGIIFKATDKIAKEKEQRGLSSQQILELMP